MDTDILYTQRNIMVALGYLAQAAWGTGTVVAGLPLTQSVVPSMSVNIGPGIISTLTTVDPNSYGSLGTDGDACVKLGVNSNTTTLTLTAPTTAGQSINYLIEASFAEADTNSVVLPYFNPTTPSLPYSGPSNSGSAQNTVRTQRCSIQLKAGAAATTGTQTTPAVDSGWVGLYVITVNYAQTTITTAQLGTNGAMVLYPGAPFITQNLAPGTFRTKATANVNLYVSSTGNDGNIGTSTAFPFLTIQAAVNMIMTNYDLNGYSAIINIGAGSFSGCTINGQAVGGASFQLVGAGSASTTVTSSAAPNGTISCQYGGSVTISNMKITATGGTPGTGANGLFAQLGSVVTIGAGVSFGACTSWQIYAQSSAQILTQGNAYSISGGGYGHICASSSGFISVTSSTITLTGTPAFTVFCTGQYVGIVAATSCTFSGSATGARYLSATNSIVNSGGGGASYFPGSSAGSVATQGQYF
jgi:hypothetical protein